MNACELTAAVTALANTLACNLSDEQLTLLASVLVQLGDTPVPYLHKLTVPHIH